MACCAVVCCGLAASGRQYNRADVIRNYGTYATTFPAVPASDVRL